EGGRTRWWGGLWRWDASPACTNRAGANPGPPPNRPNPPGPAVPAPASPTRHPETAAAVTAAAIVAAILDVVARLPIVGAHRRSSLAPKHFAARHYSGACRRRRTGTRRARARANLDIVSKRFTRHGAIISALAALHQNFIYLARASSACRL